MKKLYLMAICLLLFSVLCSGQVLSGTVEFVVNTDTIIENSNWINFTTTILPKIKENHNQIEHIRLIGSASPEGRADRNLYLANQRAQKIKSYFNGLIDNSKIQVDNDLNLFLLKTGRDRDDYGGLRSTYIEVVFTNKKEEVRIDTVYITNEVVIERVIEKENLPAKEEPEKLVLSLYNNILEDLLYRANIGLELYLSPNMSLFVGGSFSRSPFLGKTYNINYWHLGSRGYFGHSYDKFFLGVYGCGGYFDTNLFGEYRYGAFFGGGLECGYKFSLSHGWKIYPLIRLGVLSIFYNGSGGGNISLSFDDYTYGGGEKIDGSKTQEESMISRVIDPEFYKTSTRTSWIGPTHIGLVIQKDFKLKHKRK